MLTPKLFLAQKLEKELSRKMSLASPSVLNVFTSGGERYLSKREINGSVYFGKYLPAFCSLKLLRQTEKNLITLLQKVFPQTPITAFQISLMLVEGMENETLQEDCNALYSVETT